MEVTAKWTDKIINTYDPEVAAKKVAQTATITTNGATTADDAALVDDGVNKKKISFAGLFFTLII